MCNHRRKKGHYTRVCQARKVTEENVAQLTEAVEGEIALLGSPIANADEGQWMIEIKMDHCNIVCKTQVQM